MPPQPSLKGTRVLIMDDDVDSAGLLQVIFDLEQVETRTVYSSIDALEVVNSFQPDLILSDLMMPTLDGWDFIRQLRSQGNQTPTIAVTAAVRQQDREAAMRAGFSGYITKPIDVHDVLKVVLKTLGIEITSSSYSL